MNAQYTEHRIHYSLTTHLCPECSTPINLNTRARSGESQVIVDPSPETGMQLNQLPVRYKYLTGNMLKT